MGLFICFRYTVWLCLSKDVKNDSSEKQSTSVYDFNSLVNSVISKYHPSFEDLGTYWRRSDWQK